MQPTYPPKAINQLRISFESDLNNPVPSKDMLALLEQNLFAGVSDAVLSFLGDWGVAGFHEDDFILETGLTKDQFMEMANAHDLFRLLGIKIKVL